VSDFAPRAALSGDVSIPAALPLKATFPRLAAAVCETAPCGLASSTSLVGTESPGPGSEFTYLSINFKLAGGAFDCRVSETIVTSVESRCTCLALV